ncbi:hemagglutinin repeat-containing protein [Saezia sanguinis]|uniref:two-partner secretion domain-containing protein n=1 Tax=Saezia sanguinis TaxID=1965230 RepID=UPI00306C8857
MNRQCYRTIFSVIRNQFMAVQETATSLGKGKHGGSKPAVAKRRSLKLKQLALAMLLGIGSMHGAIAQIIADPNAANQHRPNVTTPPNSNGVPVVNITAPSAAGVSRNLYHQFDVQQQGAVLNNSVFNTQTQLGGWIQGNPNLAGGAARVILNEVTSGNPSLLRGYIEVGGQRAEVVIANPAGISVNGGGFINAAGVTLTTGRPQFNQFGNLESYRVAGGAINISGDGLDTSTADYTRLIARAVEVNAGLWANDLSVTAGTGTIAPDATPIQLTVEDEDGKPLYAIDVAYLGGMYAGKISLVGTESGVGVRNAGHIGASAGQVAITTDGQLLNTGTVNAMGSGASIQVAAAGNIDNIGTITSQGNLQVQSQQQLNNRGLIDGESALVSAQTVNNVGTGRIYGTHLAVQADTLNNHEETVDGQTQAAVIAARSRLDIGAREVHNQENAYIYSAGDMVIGGILDVNRLAQGKAELIQNDGAKIESAGNMWLQAQQISNTNSNYTWEYETEALNNGNTITQVAYDPSKPFDVTEVKIVRYGQVLNIAFTSVGQLWQELRVTPENSQVLFPDGRRASAIYILDTRQTSYTPVTVTSQPGEILSGGQMVLDGDLLNDRSRIQAGGTLATTGSVQVEDAQENQYIQRSGTWRLWIMEDDHISSSNTGVLSDRVNNTLVSLTVATPQSHTAITDGGLSVPNNAFYKVIPGSNSNYLIETDPRFANYATWLTSDYMLTSLGLDPSLVQKRLGDGFYEQQLIREQVGELTGFRFLAGYSSDEEQYRALMNAGVEFAQAYGLTVGVELTAEQMAQLTTDIVWLVSQDVAMADGSVETVLVPKVYARNGTSIVTPDGSLLSGNNVLVASADNTPITLNNSATIAARQSMVMDVEHMQNNVGQIHANDLYIHSATDIDNVGGTLSANNSLVLDADRNINVASTVVNGQNINGHFTEVGNVGGVYLTGDTAGGQLVMQAGQDINLNAALIANASQDGTTTLAAGQDINIGTVTTEYQQTLSSRSSSRRHSVTSSGSQEVGSVIQTTGDLNMVAGNALTVRGSSLTSDAGAINANADSITIEAARSTENLSQYNRHSSSMGLMNITSTTRSERNEGTVDSSNLSAERINLASNQDLNIIGSNVVATHDVNLSSAQGDVNIVAGTGNLMQYEYERTKSSGLSYTAGLSGLSLTYGIQQDTSKDRITSDYAVGSTVGSLEGNVNVSAQNGNYNQIGSDVIALNGDINVIAQDINVVEARESSYRERSEESKSTGFTIGIGGPGSTAVSIVQNAATMATRVEQADSSRMRNLAAGAVALNVYNNSDKLAAEYDMAKDSLAAIGRGDLAGAIPNTGFKISAGVTTSKSETSSTQNTQTAAGSTMQANNINLVATGKPNSTTGESEGGNITIRGSDITGSQDVLLAANNQVNILAASNTDNFESDSRKTSGSFGVSLGVDAKGGVNLGANIGLGLGKGSENSSEQTWTNSHVTAGNTMTIISGGDTNIIGGQVAGETVRANVGGDLNIESLQDTYSYESSKSNTNVGVNVGVAITPAGLAPTGGGSLSMSRQNVESDYASVSEYSGIMAGDGGFDVTVGGNTDLKGAVIASTQEAVDNNRNQFTTGSLTTSDIVNTSSYDATGSSSSASVSLDAKGSWNGVANSSGNYRDNGSDNSVTVSGISAGQITITDEAEQQRRTGQAAEEAVAAVNDSVRTGQGENTLERVDTGKISAQTQASVEIMSEFNSQFKQASNTYLKNQLAEATKLRDQAKTLSDSDPNKQILLSRADQIENVWGANGSGRIALTAIVGAVSGNLTGSGTEILQGAAVNAIQSLAAHEIKELTDNYLEGNSAARAALHSILACGGAAAQGGDCGSGALGGAASVVINELIGGNANNLTEEQKTQRANLVESLVTGVTNIVGGDGQMAGLAARIETENNQLSHSNATEYPVLGNQYQIDQIIDCPQGGGKCIVINKRPDDPILGGYGDGVPNNVAREISEEQYLQYVAEGKAPPRNLEEVGLLSPGLLSAGMSMDAGPWTLWLSAFLDAGGENPITGKPITSEERKALWINLIEQKVMSPAP